MKRRAPSTTLDLLAEYFAEHPGALFLLQIVPTLVFVLAFVFVPIGSIFAWSFLSVEGGRIVPEFSIRGYLVFFGIGHPDFRFVAFLRTLRVAAMQTGIAVLFGFAIAYFAGIKMRHSRYTLPLLLLFAVPFLTNYLLRTLSWRMVLQTQGLINSALLFFGFTEQPFRLLFTEPAVHVGLLASYLPFAIFPIWLAMSRIDETVLAASADLGGRPHHTLFRVVIPLTLPGILIGAVFVFVGVLGDNVVPELLGGPGNSLIANMIDDAVLGSSYNVAGAIAAVILALAFVLILLWERFYGLKRIGEI